MASDARIKIETLIKELACKLKLNQHSGRNINDT